MLAREAFSDDKVIEAVKDFVPVLVDGMAETQVTKKLKVEGFPHVRFQTLEGKPLARVGGYIPADQFLKAVEKAQSNLRKKEEKPASP